MLKHYGEALRAKLRCGQGTPYRREIVMSLVKAVMYELMGNVDESRLAERGCSMGRQREVLFKRFMELLAGTQVKPRCVSWYAARLYVTPKYLSTVCRQVSGRTAFAWINEYVMADIRHWLKNSDKTVKEIAHLLDFPNLSFFGKYCRQHCGLSPTEYRKLLRNRDGGAREAD